MTLEALHQIIKDYIPEGYRYEVEPYTLTDDESNAMIGNKGHTGDRDGYHMDICPKHREHIIETLFIRRDMAPNQVKWYVSISIQRLQRRSQPETVTPYLKLVK